ncbi:FMN-binding protein [Oscillospiraceae bacterium LTW-04]|nr:FMN-binding protein [Oscillospiraceae bacterium MB24-C1]
MKKRVKIVLGVVILAVIISGAFITSYLVSVKNYKTAVEKITYNNQNALDVSDGFYIGECDVQFIYAKVKVTVKDHGITDIQLLEHRHDRGAAAESILKEIIDKQKIDVDTVVGATNSSKVIIKLSTMPCRANLNRVKKRHYNEKKRPPVVVNYDRRFC